MFSRKLAVFLSVLGLALFPSLSFAGPGGLPIPKMKLKLPMKWPPKEIKLPPKKEKNPMLRPISDQIEFGLPTYFGEGCPKQSMSSVLSPDHRSLSALFDQASVEAGPTSRAGRSSRQLANQTKVCSIMIPLNAPVGLSLASIKSDFRGFFSAPNGTSAQVALKQWLADDSGVQTVFDGQKTYPETGGESEGEFVLTAEAKPSWNTCTGKALLLMDLTLGVTSNFDQDSVMLMVDSADLGLSSALTWKKCGGSR
ncbi:DUF4360 domain-containing protein [Bdellovibrionota bacterium FG-2]